MKYYYQAHTARYCEHYILADDNNNIVKMWLYKPFISKKWLIIDDIDKTHHIPKTAKQISKTKFTAGLFTELL